MDTILAPTWPAATMSKQMEWAIQSTIELWREQKSSLNFRQFAAEMAAIFVAEVAETQPDTTELFDASDLARVADGYFSRKSRQGNPDWFQSVDLGVCATELVRVFAIYAQSLMLGAPSPLQERSTRADRYDPFANEGGFCNPVKLKLLAEQD